MNNKIKFYRKQFGLSQTALAKKIGSSQNTISSLETGVYDPRLSTALKISKVFGVSVEDIFTIETD